MFLTRSAALDTHEGRNLLGVAFNFDRSYSVSDDGVNVYNEMYRSTCANKSLSERNNYALGIMHPWADSKRSPVPIGSVQFHVADDGLQFRAIISKTRDGDEALELVNDKALTDVSIGFRSIRDTKTPTAIIREEIALKELSLCPPTFGALEGARILEVRSVATSRKPTLAEVRYRLLLLGKQ
jgi:HK97 family phage prohead protease